MQQKFLCLLACLFLFSPYLVFLWGYFQFKRQTSSKKMSLCLFQETNRRQEGERGTITETEKRHRKHKQRQKKKKKKEQAITYLSESERMNMEEPNDSKVQSSKCFTNYQAAANRINMILF